MEKGKEESIKEGWQSRFSALMWKERGRRKEIRMRRGGRKLLWKLMGLDVLECDP